MRRQNGLIRRGEIFWFKKRIFRSLNATMGIQEISLSLGTKDPMEAERRFSILLARWHALMDTVRNNRGLTRAEINALVDDFRATQFDAYRQLRCAAELVPELEPTLKQEVVLNDRFRRLLIKAIQTGDYCMVRGLFDEHLEARGYQISRSDALYGEIIRSMALATFEVFDSIARGDMPVPSKIAAAVPQARPAANDPSPPDPPAIVSKTIDDLTEPYIRERKRGGISDSFIKDIRTGLRWLSQWFGGDRPLGSLTVDEMREFKEGLLLLPSNWSKKLKGMTIRQAAEANRDGHLQRLEIEALAGKRWKPVTEFLKWACRERYIPADPSSGMSIDISKSHKQAKKRDEFEIEDLVKIFNAPVFRGAASGSKWYQEGDHQIRDHRFWLPLLALFTGGRRGELCPLRVEDVVERGGILCVKIREHFDEKGERVSSIKNAESERLVPIHPELVKIGFRSFVEGRRRVGKVQLFDCPEARGFDQFGKWFGRLLKSVGVKTSKNSFHSFRHTMEQAMRESIEDLTARSRITGRTNNHSSEDYGKGHTVKTLHGLISKIEYPGLDLSALHETPPQAQAAA